MLLAADQRKALGSIDGARGGEVGLRPQHKLAIALAARKPNAFAHQAAAQPMAARPGLDEKQPPFPSGAFFFDHKDATDRLAVHVRDPAALALRIELLDELRGDL